MSEHVKIKLTENYAIKIPFTRYEDINHLNVGEYLSVKGVHTEESRVSFYLNEDSITITVRNNEQDYMVKTFDLSDTSYLYAYNYKRFLVGGSKYVYIEDSVQREIEHMQPEEVLILPTLFGDMKFHKNEKHEVLVETQMTPTAPKDYYMIDWSLE